MSSAATGLSGVSIQAAVATRGVDLDLQVPADTVTALVGPNGAGKSTALGLIAGLVRPSAGRVQIGDEVVATPTRVQPAHRRRAVLLTQDAALFPHLDVLANVAFGPRSAGRRRAAAEQRARDELEQVGCADLAARRPDELSGGQAQRVAIARALATDPEVVLLDEPLAGLDVAVAAQVRHVLAERLTKRTAVLVTHEVLDIWTIADQVAVIEDGRVVEQGPRTDVLTRPTSGFAAQLAGTNLLFGTAMEGNGIDLNGVTLQGLADPDQPPRPSEPALASFAPAAVSLHLDSPGGSPRNNLAVEVTSVEPRGEIVRVHLVLGDHRFAADLTPPAVAELGLRPGMPAHAAVKATQVRLYGR